MTTPEQYRSTFGLYSDGQAVLDDLQRLFGAPPFDPANPHQTAYNCGARAVLEHILAMVAKGEHP